MWWTERNFRLFSWKIRKLCHDFHMSTIHLTQIAPALYAELSAKNEEITKLRQELQKTREQRDLIKTKWELLSEKYHELLQKNGK